MIAKAEKFEGHLTAMGAGAFGKLEYDGNGIVLRAATLKTPDRGSSVRMYFDGYRHQVMTGRRFDIMGELWLMRQNNAYRIYTHIKLDEELPDGVSVAVELTDDAKDVMGLMSAHVEPGELISFTVFTFRNMEFDHMCSLANLVFYSDNIGTEIESGESEITLKDVVAHIQKLERIMANGSLELDSVLKADTEFDDSTEDNASSLKKLLDQVPEIGTESENPLEEGVENWDEDEEEPEINTTVPEVGIIESEIVKKPEVPPKKTVPKTGNSTRTRKTKKKVNEGTVPKKTATKKTAESK